MIDIQYDSEFDSLKYIDDKSEVFQVIPQVFGDNRGTFAEEYSPNTQAPDWFKDLTWVKQMNRSTSSKLVVRGMHAQNGAACQAKLVEAITYPIFDFILDMRPMSKTFGKVKAYLLDPEKHNKLFVPRGFFHGFVVPEVTNPVYKNVDIAVFAYMCDNTYDKKSELCINPEAVILPYINVLRERSSFDPDIINDNLVLDLISSFNDVSKLVFSDKDQRGSLLSTMKDKIATDFDLTKKLWYK